MAVLVGAVAGAAFSFGAAETIGGAVGSALLGRVIAGIGGAVVSNLVGRALGSNNQPQAQQFQEAARGVLVNDSSNVGPIPVIYGRRLVGGAQLPPMIANGVRGPLVLVTILSEGQIDSINTIYADGVPITDQKIAGSVVYQARYVGTDAQAADPWLLNNVAGWSPNDRFLGCAYIVLALAYNQAAFPSGKPTITADVNGRLLYDPRDGGTRFSNNPALAIRDWHAHARYGRGIASGNIDDTAFSAAANDCETRISFTNPTFTADSTTEQITFASNQAFTVGAEVRVSNSGGALPAPLAANTTYFVIPLSATVVQLASTAALAAAGTPINLTTNGTGTQTLTRAPVFIADPDTGLISFDHDEVFGLGDGVVCLTDGTLPAGLSPATTYYFVPCGVSNINGRVNGAGLPVAGLSQNCGRLATTYANALAGITTIHFTTGGTGIHALAHVDMQRYTCDGVINPDDGWLNNLRALLACCRGIRPFTGGKFRLKIDKLTTPTAFGFTEDNIVGAWTIQGRSKKSSFNRVTAQFFNPAKNWQPDLAVFDSAADRTVDNGLLLESKISLLCTANYFRALMIAQIEEQQSRFGVVIQFTATIAGMQCEVGDVVPISESGYGWVAKPFRILQMELFSSDEVQITCIEYDDSVYNVSSIPMARTFPATRLPDAFSIARQIPPMVSGLEIVNAPAVNRFAGRDVKWAWRRASNTGSYDIGLHPWGADGGLMDAVFKDYKVEIHDDLTDALLRTDYVQDPSYTYTYEHNLEDGNGTPTRYLKIKVWQRTKYDQISALPAQLSAQNPQCGAPTNVTIRANFKNIFIGYTPPPDTDWAGIIVWMGLTTPSTTDTVAGVGYCAYVGTDPLIVLDAQPGVTYHLIFAAFDNFGKDWMINSTERTITTDSIQTYDVAPRAITSTRRDTYGLGISYPTSGVHTGTGGFHTFIDGLFTGVSVDLDTPTSGDDYMFNWTIAFANGATAHTQKPTMDRIEYDPAYSADLGTLTVTQGSYAGLNCLVLTSSVAFPAGVLAAFLGPAGGGSAGQGAICTIPGQPYLYVQSIDGPNKKIYASPDPASNYPYLVGAGTYPDSKPVKFWGKNAGTTVLNAGVSPYLSVAASEYKTTHRTEYGNTAYTYNELFAVSCRAFPATAAGDTISNVELIVNRLKR